MRAVSLWLLAFVTQAASAAGIDWNQWHGHLATLQQAHVACHDTDSMECLPFLAQAVAVADVMTDLIFFKKGTYSVPYIPGFDGQTKTCGSGFHDKLNGEDLLHLTLASSFPRESTYWDHALVMTAMHVCDTEKP